MPSDDPSVASIYDLREERRAGDSALTVQLLADLTALMQEGHLPADLGITRHRLQVVLSPALSHHPFPAEALEVVRERWPDGRMDVHHRATYPRGASRRTKATVQDAYRYTALLRPVDITASQWSPDVPPRLEVWSIFRPHQCTQFTGYTDPSGRPRWRCADFGCKRVLGIRAAQAKGLQP